MSQPGHIFLSASHPYPDIFQSGRYSSLLSGSKIISGQNMVCITSNAIILDHSARVRSSMFIVIISLINPLIEDYFSFALTSSVSVGTNFFESVR